MSIIQDPGSVDQTTVYVCITCRVEGDTSELRAGRRLHDALAVELGGDPDLRVAGVECLGACRRSCTVSLAAPGKWTTIYGDLPAEDAAPLMAATARLYAAAPDGLIPWKLRDAAIKKGAIARIPPLAAPGHAR